MDNTVFARIVVVKMRGRQEWLGPPELPAPGSRDWGPPSEGEPVDARG